MYYLRPSNYTGKGSKRQIPYYYNWKTAPPSAVLHTWNTGRSADLISDGASGGIVDCFRHPPEEGLRLAIRPREISFTEETTTLGNRLVNSLGRDRGVFLYLSCDLKTPFLEVCPFDVCRAHHQKSVRATGSPQTARKVASVTLEGSKLRRIGSFGGFTAKILQLVVIVRT